MNVVILINDREAIPVRAIPLLTYWEVLSPDDLAAALTGEDDFNQSFESLLAHQLLDGGTSKPVAKSFWANFVVRELAAVSERIQHSEVSHEDGYDQWRRESLVTLPAGVFVWRDEFEECFWRKFGPDGEMTWISGDTRAPRNESIQLDFDPFIPSIELQGVVMEGFSPATPGAAATSTRTMPAASPKASDGKALGTRERNTLLTIIAVLCKEAKIDFEKHAKAGNLIEGMAARMALQIDEKTISLHLKKIPGALESRMK